MDDDVAWQSRVTQSLPHVFMSKKLAQEDKNHLALMSLL